ncbi:hypothetical protein LCGC14_2780840 [marine sediment metagenome]|uniref:Uncharacterized protein n=1 Tax=marine sediment metagenome TaxID=412755 RepID=A0A0F8YTB5_9ZZZZ
MSRRETCWCDCEYGEAEVMYIRCKYCVFFHADGSECREDSAGKQAQTSSGYWCGKWVHRETGVTFLHAKQRIQEIGSDRPEEYGG